MLHRRRLYDRVLLLLLVVVVGDAGDRPAVPGVEALFPQPLLLLLLLRHRDEGRAGGGPLVVLLLQVGWRQAPRPLRARTEGGDVVPAAAVAAVASVCSGPQGNE